jgi:hypothetical protein
MLSRISQPLSEIGSECVIYPPLCLYERNEKEDMKKAIEFLYEFKEKLSELHPTCLNAIEHMLQYRSC